MHLFLSVRHPDIVTVNATMTLACIRAATRRGTQPITAEAASRKDFSWPFLLLWMLLLLIFPAHVMRPLLAIPGPKVTYPEEEPSQKREIAADKHILLMNI